MSVLPSCLLWTVGCLWGKGRVTLRPRLMSSFEQSSCLNFLRATPGTTVPASVSALGSEG